jgi:polysaccharide biosynthesis protein PslH
MKILIISHKPPYPSVDGGCLAMAKLAEGLKTEHVDVAYACLSTEKHPFRKKEFEQTSFPVLGHRKVNTTPTLLGYLRSFFGQSSYLTDRFYCAEFSKELASQLIAFQPDVVLFESLFSAVYLDDLRGVSKAKIVLRSHNLEADLWQKKVSAMGKLKQLILQPAINRLEKLEQRIFKQVDGVMAISSEEVNYCQQIAPETPVIHIPMGINLSPVQTFEPAKSFFHIGAMDWEPNIQGINWLVQSVWPSVHAKSGYSLHLAGKGLQSEEYQLPGIVNHGEVDHAERFMQSHGIMVVPLFQASGIRIKLLEAGALGIPVIATPQAVGSLPLVHEEDLLIASNEQEFSEAMNRLIVDFELQQKLAQGIRKKIELNFSSSQIHKQAVDFLRHI